MLNVSFRLFIRLLTKQSSGTGGALGTLYSRRHVRGHSSWSHLPGSEVLGPDLDHLVRCADMDGPGACIVFAEHARGTSESGANIRRRALECECAGHRGRPRGPWWLAASARKAVGSRPSAEGRCGRAGRKEVSVSLGRGRGGEGRAFGLLWERGAPWDGPERGLSPRE